MGLDGNLIEMDGLVAWGNEYESIVVCFPGRDLNARYNGKQVIIDGHVQSDNHATKPSISITFPFKDMMVEGGCLVS